MKNKAVSIQLTVITLIFLVAICTSAFSAPVPPTPKPQVLLEMLSTPVLLSGGKTARLAVTILPCNICRIVNSNGAGIASGSTTCDRTVTVRLSIRRLTGEEVKFKEATLKTGEATTFEVPYDSDDFLGVNPVNIIGSVCVTSTNTKKKWPSCCAIVNASLQIYSVEGDEIESDSLTPLLPLAYYQPATINF